MDIQRLYDFLHEIIMRKEYKLEEGVNLEHLSLRSDLAFDSFDLAELTVRIEDEYSIDIFEMNENIDTVIDIIEIITKR
ncbi:phosphopantetheine-binding protein [Paenibacillus woosongensis]|uniref:Phosphopantetheine-binding protein n=1 Tax=Paenibacillus woosongensis TaxID=307580 RepID=A0AA95ICT6_9BACL|nr:phosphopantetheine-binding protein [Paenibacillus woosongensis]WHX50792.1 phosphopantetheine-binding protein [Paenibacillus woosongensis]